MTTPIKQDSLGVGLRIAVEETQRNLPDPANWIPEEPNSFNSDHGGEYTNDSRDPITDHGQEIKGNITSLKAQGGFNTDVSPFNVFRYFQGLLMSNIVENATSIPMNSPAIPITDIDNTGKTYAVAGLGAFVIGQLLLAKNMGVSANNGLKHVISSTASLIGVSESLVAEASPPALGSIQAVGFEFDVATVDVDTSGDLVTLVRASGSQDWTTIGIAPNQWMRIGGDDTANQFLNPLNNGFASVLSVTPSAIVLNKASNLMVDETGTSILLQVFFGNQITNPKTLADRVERTYQLERALGDDGNGTQYDYVLGAMVDEVSLVIDAESRMRMDVKFKGSNYETKTGSQGAKAGNRPALISGETFNTSTDLARMRLAPVSDTNEFTTSLSTYLVGVNLTISNGVITNSALGELAGFSVSPTKFMVTGDLTAYFTTHSAVNAVANNQSQSLDFCLVADNAGLLFDMPEVGLSNARPDIVKGQSIKLPLGAKATRNSTVGFTFGVTQFPYLPDAV